jgi:hypothetical protein
VTRRVNFENLPPLQLNAEEVKADGAATIAGLNAASASLEGDQKTALATAASKFEEVVAIRDDINEWAASTLAGVAALNAALKTAKIDLDGEAKNRFQNLHLVAQRIAGDKDAFAKAHAWVLGRLPVFILLDEYPQLDGYKNLREYTHRKSNNQLNNSDVNFEKLCKVAGLSVAHLQQLLSEGKHEERNQLANRASAVVTTELRRLWKDRQLKVRFNLDGEHFQTLISDPTAAFDVEVNLDERSRGLRWFFSFYITFSADTDGGRASNAILLLDEPGLFLHIESQKDLQVHFEKDFENQIIYTTHSPFMIPIQTLDRLRTVNISEEIGTTVTNNPTGDGRTLAPIRAALGYYYADSLFLGPNNLIVEGVTDWWILEAVSKHFVNAGKLGLPQNLALPPVDGAPKVPNMVSMLTSQRLNVLVLLDDEKQARMIRDEMVTSRLVREHQVIFVSDVFDSAKPAEADIEDLLDPTMYEALARDAYAKELQGKTLKLNVNIPRIVKRLEKGFEEIGLAFHKTRTDGLFFRKMAADPASVMTGDTTTRFDSLFLMIRERLEKVIERGNEQFH